MKIGSRKALFEASVRGNYMVMNRKEWKNEKSKHRNKDHSMRKGLASRLRWKLKRDTNKLLDEE